MNANDDPFFPRDVRPTAFVRPTPAGIARNSPLAKAPVLSRAPQNASVAATPSCGPLVACAFSLLSAAPLLRSGTPPASPEQLRAHVEDALQAFEDCASAKGVDHKLVASGRYALCALLDDVVLNTPWGAQGAWRTSSLAVTFYRDAAAGQHFFERLEEAKRQPQRTQPLLELMAACLALGFEGKYRRVPNGELALRQVKEVLAAVLRQPGEDGNALSGHWQGSPAAHVPIVRRVPLWVFGSAAVGLLALAYVMFAIRLGDLSGRLDATVAGLPPGAPVGIVRRDPLPPDPGPRPTLEPRLRACLPAPGNTQPDTVKESYQSVRVLLPNAGLFASSSADLQAAIQPVIVCLANVLKDTTGKVNIVGHTDDVPIRTPRFPNNWELSRARAAAVAELFSPVIGAGRVLIAGRSNSEPVASNATEEGRSRNRRVEIMLVR